MLFLEILYSNFKIAPQQLQTVEERYALKLQKLEDENASLTSAKRNTDTLLKTSKVRLFLVYNKYF
jgi:hypothetical protein